MRGSWRLTRIAGIDISIHWSFGLLLAWVMFSALFAGGVVTAFSEVAFISLLFGCVVLHELGHAMAARAFGIPTHGITLLPIGGVAQLDRIPRNPWQEFVIAIAGPAVNVVIAVGLFLVLPISYGVGELASVGWFTGGLATRLLIVNIALVVFNMLPAFPMDGGRVLRAILAAFTDYYSATRMAVRVGQGVAILFVIAGLLYNPMLLLIAAFVVLAAQAELRQVRAEREPVPVILVADRDPTWMSVRSYSTR
jgi:Zn-dependent protease